MGNSDFTPIFHEFCCWFKFFSTVGYSLYATYFLHGKKNKFPIIFSMLFFHGWLFSFELLSLSVSFAKEKSGFVVKTKG